MSGKAGDARGEVCVGEGAFAGEVDRRRFVRRPPAIMRNPVVVPNRQNSLRLQRSCAASRPFFGGCAEDHAQLRPNWLAGLLGMVRSVAARRAAYQTSLSCVDWLDRGLIPARVAGGMTA